MGTIYAMIKSSIFFSANEIVCNQTNAFENLDQVLESGNVSTKNAFVLKLLLRCLFRIAVLNGAPNEKFEGSQKECRMPNCILLTLKCTNNSDHHFD